MPTALERLTGPKPAPGPRRGIGAAVIAGLAFLVFKGKAIFVAAFGALKLGPIFVTSYTMLISAWFYARSYGWSFAIGLVLLILVHELGHGAAARKVGVPVGAPVFIPFFGAAIALRGRPRSTVDEAIIAAGGPVVGGLAAAIVVAASSLARDPHTAGLLGVVGYAGLVLNLFNLTPVWQLDGARMLRPVKPGVMLGGAAVLLVALIAAAVHARHLNPIGAIAIAALIVRAVAQTIKARRHRPPTSALEKLVAIQAAERAVPDDVPAAARHRAAAVYFGTFLALVAATHLVHDPLFSARG